MLHRVGEVIMYSVLWPVAKAIEFSNFISELREPKFKTNDGMIQPDSLLTILKKVEK